MKVQNTPKAVDTDVESMDAHAPRKMTVKENVVLTIKVLGGFGLLGAALWTVNLWTAPQ